MVDCDNKQLSYRENNYPELLVDLSHYSLTAVKKVCYKLASCCSIAITDEVNNKIKLVFQFPSPISESEKQKIINEFYSELIDQDLWEIVFKETEVTRNIILAHAFSKTALIQSE